MSRPRSQRIGSRKMAVGAAWAIAWVLLLPSIALAATCHAWRLSPTNAILPGGLLNGVSALSRHDAWAVGEGPGQSPVVHWDGRTWRNVPHAIRNGPLRSVAAIATSDVWAVGLTNPLTEHWNGTSWIGVPAPFQGSVRGLYDISATSSTDVWAVGFDSATGLNPLADHWDGTSWTQVFAPDGTPGTNEFYGVKAIAVDDAWAVGYQDLTGAADFQPLLEHWDGATWTVVATPALAGSNNFLEGVDASSSTDVWAVGIYRPANVDLPLVFHWDGTSWTQFTVPEGGGNGNELDRVKVISSTDAWAVGQFFPVSGITFQPYALHWDGTTWSLQPAPSPGGAPASFRAVAATAPKDVWAVGASNLATNGLLIEHSTGACEGAVPSATLALAAKGAEPGA